ncbi:MAG: rhodanese-like domain-containing protein [Truepera sp.]|nr:rhodanese-like domain-containing protein [Truepera sp.]
MTEAPAIDVQEAYQRTQNGSLLLDVREPDEHAEAHIPGDRLLPLTEFAERYSELPREREIVVYCRSGRRSAQVVNFLLAQGYQAINVTGGIIAWHEAELPVVSQGG